MNSLSPDGFEFFIADLMRQFGWQAQLTRASGDDGVDVLCINEDGVKCAIQCKRYSKKVGVSTVRELEGAKVMYDCQEAILATTDEFTASSFETAKKLNITLFDGDLLAFHAIPLLEPEKKINYDRIHEISCRANRARKRKSNLCFSNRWQRHSKDCFCKQV